jgi:hypothetical protein
MSGQAGNGGAGKGIVNVVPVVPGCVKFVPSLQQSPPKAELSAALAEVLERWQQEDSLRRVRAVCPVVQGGDTVGLFVWFDRPG